MARGEVGLLHPPQVKQHRRRIGVPGKRRCCGCWGEGSRWMLLILPVAWLFASVMLERLFSSS